MTKQQIAENINSCETLVRNIFLYDFDMQIGQVYDNRGKCESWTIARFAEEDFSSDTASGIKVSLICDNVPCHSVDYDNTEECEILGATDCGTEHEAIVSKDTKMIISSIEDYREEGLNFIIVHLNVAE